MSLPVEIAFRLTLARHALILSEQQIKQPFAHSPFIAASLADDAVEYILISIAEHRSLHISDKITYSQYFDKIDETLKPNKLTHRPQMLRLHNIRNTTKHKAIRVERSEIESIILQARIFICEVSSLLLGVDFNSFGYQEMIFDPDVRKAIGDAETHLKDGSFELCLYECRKVSFLILEFAYDRSFLADNNSAYALFMGYTKDSPSVLSAKDFIDNQAATLFDFIQLDRAAIEQRILRIGLSPSVFNIIEALTPRVYRGGRTKGEWVYERDFQKIQHPEVENHAVLCFQNAISLALADQTAKIQQKSAYHAASFVAPNHPNSPVYERATEISSVLGYTKESKEIQVQKEIPSLDTNCNFYLTDDYEPVGKNPSDAFDGLFRRLGYTKVYRSDG